MHMTLVSLTVKLDAFEYFMFHFAYFLVHQQNTELVRKVKNS